MQYKALKTAFGIEMLPGLEEKISNFEKIFLKHCAQTNLVSKSDEKLIWEKHFFDSCAIYKLEAFEEAKHLLDIGTGGGFPALPLAIINPDLSVVAIDSIGKKIDVIKSIKSEMKLANIEPIYARSENLGTRYFEYFDIATSRAVAPLRIILEYAIPYLKVGGYFVAYKSQSAQTEIDESQNAFKELNCELSEIIEYKLPLEEEFTRKLIVIKKTGKTPKAYPREPGQAKSNPL